MGERRTGERPGTAAGHGPAAPVPGEDGDPHCLGEGEARRLLAGHPWRRLVVLGGSAADPSPEPVPGYRSAPWYDRIASALRTAGAEPACLVLLGPRELAVGRVRSQQLARALDFRSDLALVCCDGTDLLRPSFAPDALEVELERIVTPLRDGGADVLVVGPYSLAHSARAPEPLRESVGLRQRVLMERARAVTLRHGALLLDLSVLPLPLPGTAVWGADRMRPDGRGHAVAAAAAVRRLGSFLAER
ncbi:SGNH/GDSL hydrolase family protein [Streptacidiphilus sp. ASG 303]|uniref:SGNH/GDSL hydrolase family protein n=1 Tax=Streptacidiphilus sp. ASG 303 TaxID=2896847 RepID=UPI001E4C899E|nr:SGNH/GDSL hydrolase family protein [Streptacidiphilus sp. ASG 303]MCD0484168.1 SGNH/GDSL hydrolase family protein [Streptacidiphilus sp. ASG 303]